MQHLCTSARNTLRDPNRWFADETKEIIGDRRMEEVLRRSTGSDGIANNDHSAAITDCYGDDIAACIEVGVKRVP